MRYIVLRLTPYGYTPTSLLPQEAKAIGIDFEALCEMIIDISLQKYK